MMRRFSVQSLALLATLILAGCSGGNTGPKVQVPTSLARVGGTGQSGEAGTPLGEPLVVQVRDSRGRPVSGARVAWTVTSGDGSLEGGSVSTDQSGESRVVWTLGGSAGPQTVRASLGDLAPATFSATAVAGPAASIAAVPSALAFDRLGATAQINVRVHDQHGNELNRPILEWATSDSGVARVSGNGLVTSIGAGRATISAISGETRSEISVLVDLDGSSGPMLVAVSPETILAGDTAWLTGVGFSDIASEINVLVDGVRAQVLAASSTELTIRVPTLAELGCRPTRPVDLSVNSGGGVTSRAHPLRVAGAVPHLDVGSYITYGSAAESECRELPEGRSEYLISIYNTSQAARSSAAFQLRGRSVGNSASPAPRRPYSASSRRVTSPASTISDPGPRTARWGGHESLEAHTSVLESSRQLYSYRGGTIRQPGARSGLMSVVASKAPAVGSFMDLRVPDISRDLCDDYLPVRARVVYSGTRAVVLEDTSSSRAGEMDSAYRAIGQEFEESMLPVLLENFGDPLAADSFLSGTGKILMLFTPRVNDFGGIAGFVTTADFVPRSTCASSDRTQIFYAIVPDPGETPEEWRWGMRATVAHEVKHLVSYGERIARDASALEETWLEESTARLAEELWGRQVFENTFKGNATYRNTIYCEVRTTLPGCEGKPFVMADHFATIYDYLSSSHALSPLGSQGDDDWTFYGSGWHMVRWALDHYATDEAAFIRALVQEPRLSGVRNLEARTGASFEEILGPWSLSLVWDQPTAPRLSTPSWDMVDIYQGLNRDFPNIFEQPYPYGGWEVEFGNFRVDVDMVRGGSAAFTRIRGAQQGTQLLELLGPTGGRPSSTLRMAILRVE